MGGDKDLTRSQPSRERQVMVACGCGSLVSGIVPAWLELPDPRLDELGAGGIGRVVCPVCGGEHRIDDWVLVHDPALSQAWLYLPEPRRDRVIASMVEYLRWLEENGAGAPVEVIGPRPVFGAAALRDAVASAATKAEHGGELERLRGALGDKEAELARLERNLQEIGTRLDEERARVEARAEELASAERALERDRAALDELLEEAERQSQGLDTRAQELEEAAAEQGRRSADLEVRAEELDRVARTLDDRARELDEAAERLTRERAALEAREQELTAREKELDDLARMLDERAMELDAQAERMSAGQGSSEALASREQELAALEAKVAELEQARAEESEALDTRERDLAAREARLAELAGVDLSEEGPERVEALSPLAGLDRSGVPKLDDRSVSNLGDGVGEERSAAEPGDEGAIEVELMPPAPSQEEIIATPAEELKELEDIVAKGRQEEPSREEARDGEFLEGVDWTGDLDAAWSLPGEDGEASGATEVVPIPPPIPMDQEPTRRVRMEDLRPPKPEDDEVAARSKVEAPVGPFEVWDETLAAGRDGYLALKDAEVYLCMKAPFDRVTRILESPLDLLVQLHRLEEGAAVLLTLVTAGPQGQFDEELHYWFVDHRVPPGKEALDTLAQSFRPHLVLFSDDGVPRRLLHFERPLEANVLEIIQRARDWEATHPPRMAELVAKVSSPGFDRVGRKQHPFRQDGFSHLETPARTRFALGVLSYWLEPDNRDYLVLVKGFPLEELRAMTRRILMAAMDFGLSLPEVLRVEAMAQGLVEDERQLLEKCLASYAEVCLHIRPNDLDDLAQWENWEALLTRCEELGVDVDEDIIKLAEHSMQRVQAMAAAMEGAGDGAVPTVTGPVPPVPPVPPPVPTGVEQPPPIHPGSQPPLPPPLPPVVPPTLPAAQEDGPMERPSSTIPDSPAGLGSGARSPSRPVADTREATVGELVKMVWRNPEARDVLDELAARGREGAQALLDSIRDEDPPVERLVGMVRAFAALGEAALQVVSQRIRKSKRNDPLLQRCLMELGRTLGVERLKEEPRKNRRYGDALDKAIERLEGEETRSVPPPLPDPPQADSGLAQVLGGDLEALLGVDLRAGRASGEESGEIPLDEDDILEQVDGSELRGGRAEDGD